MNTKIYKALKSAGATDEDTREGATALGLLEKEIIELKGKHTLTHWMVGFNLVLSIMIVGFLMKM